MRVTIHTEGWFDAAHHLEGYNGACANLHGHTYKVCVKVRGEREQLNKCGILWDFGNLKRILKRFDHSGDITDNESENTTAEYIAFNLFDEMKQEHPDFEFLVRVYEQIEPKQSWAEVGDLK
jgi:6-pyruvoyltetrahydropterin/6-carboxytetrahydropterin synthase